MSFLENTNDKIADQKPAVPSSIKDDMEMKEIKSLVKARGFDDGSYRFDPNSNVPSRKEGSICNGKVVGSFQLTSYDPVVLDRESFSEKAWKNICCKMGFKYHVHTDIDKFVISNGKVSVYISLITPTTES